MDLKRVTSERSDLTPEVTTENLRTCLRLVKLMSDEDDSQQDERIPKLLGYAQDHNAAETVDFLEKTLGGKSGIVYGGISFSEDFAMAHFLIMATLTNGEGKKLTVQVNPHRDMGSANCGSAGSTFSMVLGCAPHSLTASPLGFVRLTNKKPC